MVYSSGQPYTPTINLHSTLVLASVIVKRKEKKNYAGSKTFPASIKEKETNWPEKY